jgi:type I restriction enzyme, S subunit
MRAYPRYKPSGIKWLGEIPWHWEFKPIKYFSEIVLGKMLTNEDKGDYLLKRYLKAQNIGWENVDLSDVREMWFSVGELGQLRVKRDDLLVSEGGEVGRTAIWRDELPECYIQNSVNKVSIPPPHVARYFLYLFECYGKRGHFDAIVNRVSIAHLTREKVKEVGCIVPPFEDQQAIVTYLDDKTRKIDTLIEKKQRLIELLKEQRTAIINQAVTKGINPNVKMKDSGIEWIGQIPEHWSVKKLKHLLEIGSGDGISSESIFAEGDFPVFGGNGIMGYTDKFNSDIMDIIIGRVGAKCGNVHVVGGKKWISDNALRAETTENVDFVGYLLTIMNLNNLANQNAQPLITGTMVRNQLVTIPPQPEQTQLVETIKSETVRVSETIDRTQRQVNFLQEYRTALISEVVTGKIDVRNYASEKNN